VVVKGSSLLGGSKGNSWDGGRILKKKGAGFSGGKLGWSGKRSGGLLK